MLSRASERAWTPSVSVLHGESPRGEGHSLGCSLSPVLQQGGRELPLSPACAQNSRNFSLGEEVAWLCLDAACAATPGAKSPTEKNVVGASSWQESSAP